MPSNPQFFQAELVPRNASLAGYAALVDQFSISAPVRSLACVSDGHIHGGVKQQGSFRVYDKRYLTENSVEAHLSFALKNEPIDLLILKRLFQSLDPNIIANFVSANLRGVHTRKIWFLYEHLLKRELDLPDAPNVTMIDVLDSDLYFAGQGIASRRHKVRNNLLGTADFCPIIRRTELLSAYTQQNLADVASTTIGKVSQQLVSRAASFLLLADSKASFEIEGERPPRNRIERWGRAVVQAGKHQLSQDEMIRLHSILIEDNRYIQPGLRTEGVFLGDRTSEGEPLPEFIGARASDLPRLLQGLISANQKMEQAGLDPVLQAAVTAFGFVYIHPFADGNGRVHRCLIHHVLAERRFSPPGLVFPVSTAMLEWIEDYRKVLQAHSGPLMPYIDWVPTAGGNVQVNNDTADLYCYFDCTQTAEFLYRCVERTVSQDLPIEIEFLKRRDQALQNVMDAIDLPDQKAEQFILYVQRNEGSLPKSRQSEFDRLTADEIARLEEIVRQAFKGFRD